MPKTTHNQHTGNAAGTTLLNPPFHPNTRQIGSPRGAVLRRGYLVHAPTTPSGDNRGWRGRINYQYNPASISVSHPTSMNYADAAGLTGDSIDPQALQTGVMTGMGSLDLPLLFDRTYDLWDSGAKHTLGGQFGAYADVLAFYHFLGMTSVSADEPNFWSKFLDMANGLAGGGATTQFWATTYPVNPAQPTTAYAYIGDKLKFFGFIDGFSVSYTHFNHNMVPTRAAVTVTLALQKDPNVDGQKVNLDSYQTQSGDSNNSFFGSSLGGILGNLFG